jgi:hypothetical protein
VSLPGDDDHVSFVRRLEGLRDRRRAVGLHLDGRCDSGEDLLDDRLRGFAPGIVGGDDDDVGEARGDLAHERTLASIAVAPAAEDTDDAGRGEVPRLDED